MSFLYVAFILKQFFLLYVYVFTSKLLLQPLQLQSLTITSRSSACSTASVCECIIWLRFSFFLTGTTALCTFPGNARTARTDAFEGGTALFTKLSRIVVKITAEAV